MLENIIHLLFDNHFLQPVGSRHMANKDWLPTSYTIFEDRSYGVDVLSGRLGFPLMSCRVSRLGSLG